jgi:adenylate cyclase class 2
VREVEVKYRVRDLGALLAALRTRDIELGVPFCQDDQAYAPDGWAYGDDRRGVPFARLRTVDGRHVFTLKRPAENVLSCEEHEQAELSRFVASLGVDAEQTSQTYDDLVRGLPTSA